MLKVEKCLRPLNTKGRTSKYDKIVLRIAGKKDMSITVSTPTELEGIRRCARRMGYVPFYRGGRIWINEKK